MLPGISTACFYPELTERAMEILSGRVQAVEVFLNAPSELEDSFLRALHTSAKNGGTKILSVHPFSGAIEPLLLFSNYRRRTLDGFDSYKRYFHAANLLGADIVVLHGDIRGRKRPRSFYFDVYGELMEAAKRMGVTLAQENVSRCASYCPEFFAEMAAYLPHASFVLDTKQAIRGGYPIAQMVRAMDGRICHVHISDHDGSHDCLPVGKGAYDIPGLLKELHALGFNGGVIQELYRDNYGPEEELFESYLELEKIIEKTGMI